MKIKQFDVVKLKNDKKAIIKKINKGKNYLIEVISDDKTEIEQKTITQQEIKKVIYARNKMR